MPSEYTATWRLQVTLGHERLKALLELLNAQLSGPVSNLVLSRTTNVLRRHQDIADNVDNAL